MTIETKQYTGDVIRSRLAIGAFRFLHPDVSGALVDFVARRSRERSDAVPSNEQNKNCDK